MNVTVMRCDDAPIISERPMFGSDYHRVGEAIRFIDAHVEDQPSLAEVADHLGLSPFHFQRLFRRWAGITPKDFLQFLTLVRAKRHLAASVSLLETSLQVGLSGPGRLHDLFLSVEAMTPGEFKRGAEGLEIVWGVHPTPLHLVPKGTPFQIQVWSALLEIPEGETASYSRIAALAGSPSAVRAVGTALGANPIGYLIPCHRIIRSTGAVGDYRWGARRKTMLLAVEAARRAGASAET